LSRGASFGAKLCGTLKKDLVYISGMPSNKIFITSGSLYIGSRLIRELLERNFGVNTYRIPFFLLLLLPSFLDAQKIRPEKIGRLPNEINESSGLARNDLNAFWTMNDHGADRLYKISIREMNGNYVGGIPVDSVSHFDWEDLTQDDSGTVYIGDFGNNANRRHTLAVYRIKIPKNVLVPAVMDTAHSEFRISGQKISFHYQDQKQFPPRPGNWNFDCEAFLHAGDSLYLFSKNLSNPNNGFTKMYRLPDQPGSYVAELVDSFYLNEPVTSADITPDGKTVALLTYFSLWVFKDFSGQNFLDGKVFRFPFKKLTQKEAICFANDHELFVTDEKHYGRGGKLYKIDLKKLDFSKPAKKFKISFCKKVIYNFYNNPKVRYKKIMKQISISDREGSPRF
jgi:hypothetical protein